MESKNLSRYKNLEIQTKWYLSSNETYNMNKVLVYMLQKNNNLIDWK